MSRKPRSDAKLKSLPPNQREMLIRWLLDENLSYEKAVKRLEQDFNVRTSLRAISGFYATECFSLRSSEANDFAARVEKELLSSDPNFDKATLALIKQKTFERAYAKNGNLDELAILSGIIGDSAHLKLKERDIALKERRLALLEKKVEQADRAKGIVGDEKLSDEEKAARLRGLFGMG